MPCLLLFPQPPFQRPHLGEIPRFHLLGRTNEDTGGKSGGKWGFFPLKEKAAGPEKKVQFFFCQGRVSKGRLHGVETFCFRHFLSLKTILRVSMCQVTPKFKSREELANRQTEIHLLKSEGSFGGKLVQMVLQLGCGATAPGEGSSCCGKPWSQENPVPSLLRRFTSTPACIAGCFLEKCTPTLQASCLQHVGFRK